MAEHDVDTQHSSVLKEAADHKEASHILKEKVKNVKTETNQLTEKRPININTNTPSTCKLQKVQLHTVQQCCLCPHLNKTVYSLLYCAPVK